MSLSDTGDKVFLSYVKSGRKDWSLENAVTLV